MARGAWRVVLLGFSRLWRAEGERGRTHQEALPPISAAKMRRVSQEWRVEETSISGKRSPAQEQWPGASPYPKGSRLECARRARNARDERGMRERRGTRLCTRTGQRALGLATSSHTFWGHVRCASHATSPCCSNCQLITLHLQVFNHLVSCVTIPAVPMGIFSMKRDSNTSRVNVGRLPCPYSATSWMTTTFYATSLHSRRPKPSPAHAAFLPACVHLRLRRSADAWT